MTPRISPFFKPYPALFLASLLAWGAALFMQHVLDMHPCSLCILQRWALTAVLVGAGLAWALEGKAPSLVRAALPALGSLAGIVIAAKHLWLQLAPHNASEGCGFGGEMVLESFPLAQAIPQLFAGSGDCASLPPVLGAPLPFWTLLLFVGSLAITALASQKTRKSP